MHDHPNKVVLFNMYFGEFEYISYDKLEDKYRYNQFTDEEYDQMTSSKFEIEAQIQKNFTIKGPNQLLMLPSSNNVHEFTAKENTCFFDVSWPNYNGEVKRRKSYLIEQKDKRKEDGRTVL